MIVPKLFLKAALKFIMPEVMKLIIPLQKYKDEPNDADNGVAKLEDANKAIIQRLHNLEKHSHPQIDWTDQIASLAKNMESKHKEMQIFVNTANEAVIGKMNGIGDRFDQVDPKVIKLDAMVTKFDRDLDYMERNINLLKDALSQLVKGKDA